MSEEEKAELQEANDEIVWWHNRFNAVQRDYENLQKRIDKAIEFLHNNTMIGHCKEHYELLEILGDKENDN